MAKTCRVCGTQLQSAVLPDFSGTHRNVQITFSKTPALVCPQGHEKKMVDGEFPMYVLLDILEGTPLSKVKGFGKKQHVCNKCNTSLEGASLENRHFQVQLNWKNESSFVADVAAPSAKCSSCMTFQILKTREIEQDEIPEAIAHAFDGIQVMR